MDPWLMVWGLCLMATLWFLPIGLIRLVAYRSGQADHTRGMHFVARMALTLGVVALVLLIGVSIVMLSRS